MSKAELRNHYLNLQKKLTETEREVRSWQITQHFLDYFSSQSQVTCLHSFLPIHRNGEVNTWHILKDLFAYYPQVKVVVPRMLKGNALENVWVSPQTVFVQNQLGIPEPTAGKIVAPDTIDLVLVPLLAYDQLGYRVGYGKGFYDRFLTQCRQGVIKIGLSYFPPHQENMAAEPWDVRLDMCIQPLGMTRFE
jgi:5-formyltetrahydrofolate cyclo-ligase